MQRRSLMLMAPRQLAWAAEDLPPPGPNEVLVRTIAGAVSVGTELPLYLGTHRGSRPVDYPRMTGYESFAEVIACGTAVRDLVPGDRVLAFYGHRTHAILPARRAIRVPGDIAAGLALLAILSCDVAKGITKTAPRVDQPVLVTGAGTIGLLTVFNLHVQGYAHIDVIEPLPERRALALALGASAALAPDHAGMPGEDYQAGFECSGRDLAFGLLQARMAHGGRVCVLSDGNTEPLTLAPAFHERELQLIGSSDGLDYQQHAAWFFAHTHGAATQLERLYEVRTAAERLPQAFEEMARGPAPIKILVDYIR